MKLENSEIRAFLYIRTSTIEQKNSIDTQEKQLKDFCKLRGYKIAGTFKDWGQSGKNTDRPEFKAMMAQIMEGSPVPVDLVLCTKLDRFARSLMDLNAQVLVLSDHGVRFATLQQEFDINSPTGKLMFNMLGSFAEFERGLILERTKEGYKAALERGVICNRPKIDLPKKKVLEYILEKGLSASAVGKIYGVSTGTVKNRLNEWGYFYDSPNWIKRSVEEC